MKKALIITYYWPPSGGAGVQRWLKFVKYLREFGWEPVIYTPLNPDFPIVDATLSADIPVDIEVSEPLSGSRIPSTKKLQEAKALPG